jgi:4'-phosphopantetheinyl transferase
MQVARPLPGQRAGRLESNGDTAGGVHFSSVDTAPAMTALPPLSSDLVQLWYTQDTCCISIAKQARSVALLSPEERARLHQFRFEVDRDQFLISRLLVRVVLSAHLGVAPDALVFSANEWGKPFLVSPAHSRLQFNISHTRGAVICGITLDQEIGVDLEAVQYSGDTDRLVSSAFAPAEIAALQALPAWRAARRFIDYWTLKEAYAKGRGLGLSLPLDAFTIELEEGREPLLKVDRTIDDGCSWQLQLTTIGGQYRAACAVRRSDPFVLETIPIAPHSLERFSTVMNR